MTVELAEETHYAFALWVLLFVLSKQFVQFIWIARLFLTVSRFVPKFTAVMAPDSTLAALTSCLAWIPFRVTSFIIFSAILISPVTLCWEISQSNQTELVMFDQRLYVLFVASWAEWAKAKNEIVANLALSVTHWTIV